MNWLDTVTGPGRVTVHNLEWLPLEFIAFNLRSADRREVFGNLPSDNALELAAMVFHAVGKKGVGWIARFDGRPAGTIGCFENFPGNWQIFSFGTDAYRRVLPAFKPKLDALTNFSLENGARRLECKSHIMHTESQALLRIVGFTPEAVLRSYGRDGADYVLFSKAWDHEKNLRSDVGDARAARARGLR